MTSDVIKELLARQQVVATLAAALITASGRPHSIAETLDLFRDVQFGLYPDPRTGGYNVWAEEKDERLRRVRN